MGEYENEYEKWLGSHSILSAMLFAGPYHLFWQFNSSDQFQNF